MTNKLERDGKVAALISPNFGAGWSTWNSKHRDYLLFDAELVQAVLDGNKDKAARIAEQKCPEVYVGGAEDLVVQWLDKGTVFEVEEYDGHESLHIIGDGDYPVA